MVLGKRLIKGKIEITELLMYKRDASNFFFLEKQQDFEFDEFTCSQFTFDKNDNNKLLFLTATEIIRYDYTKDEADEQEETIYTLNNYLLDPPNFGIFNEDQTACIVTSINDIIYIDITTGFELDIDEKENIGDILNILADERFFYVLANKKHDTLGYYLFMVDKKKPEQEYTYLINWTNKTNIREVDLNFLDDYNDEGEL